MIMKLCTTACLEQSLVDCEENSSNCCTVIVCVRARVCVRACMNIPSRNCSRW